MSGGAIILAWRVYKPGSACPLCKPGLKLHVACGGQIVAALCCVGLAIATGLLCCLNRACTRRRAAAKVYYSQDVRRTSRQRQQQYMANGGSAVTNGSGGYLSHYAGGREHAVVYDERSGQFVVNGRPYGSYQFDAQRGYYPTRG